MVHRVACRDVTEGSVLLVYEALGVETGGRRKEKVRSFLVMIEET